MSDGFIYTRDGFPVGGYRFDAERVGLIQRYSTDVSDVVRSRITAAENFDPRPLFGDRPREMRTEDQGSIGSCNGFGGSSTMELGNWIETNHMIQMSPAYLYIAAQEKDGISGDRGSTISGAVEVLTKHGIPREEVWPYFDRYDPRPPGGWERQFEAAAEFKAGSHTYLTDWKDVVQYIRAGLGGVHIGISWGGEVDRNGVFRWQPGQGGHSVCFLGWKMINGDMFLWMLNSWGNRWGDDGWALVNASDERMGVKAMLRHNHTVMVGYTMQRGQPRQRVDFTKRTLWA